MERKLFYNHRPIKIWYIIDENVSIDFFQTIILFNMNIGWWRYNQIFLLEDSKLPELDFERMKSYDADVYVCLCDITKELKEFITIKFSPLEILIKDKIKINNWHISFNWDIVHTNPVTVMPEKRLISKIWFWNHKFINFIIDKSLDSSIKDIIGINFWYIEDKWWYYSQYLSNIDHEDKEIKWKKDLIAFLEDGNYNYNIYKNQLSHTPHIPIWKLSYKADNIYLIIGNSTKDYLSFWNRNIFHSERKWSFINTFILPINNLEENKDLIESFLKFIEKYSWNQNQNNNKPNVIISSYSFTEEELKKVITNKIIEKKLNIYEWANFSTYNHMSLDHQKYVSLYEKHNTVRIDKEDLWNTHMANELYMTDIFLEYDKSEYIGTIDWDNKTLYLQYNRNNKATSWVFWNKNVRINKQHWFSQPFDKSERESWFMLWNFDDNRFEIKVKFPSESDIIRWTMLLSDLLEEYKWNFKDIKQSDAGKKVRAILNLSKWNLHFWENLLNDSKRKEIFIKYTQIFNKDYIEQKIKKILDKKGDIPSNTLSEKIYNNVYKTANLKDRYLTLTNILQDRWINNELIKKYKSIRNTKDKIFNEDEKRKLEDVLYTVNDLKNMWILRQGIEFKCKYCWEKYWISINDIKEKIKCRWCWETSKSEIEYERNYAFNSILKWSDAKWTFAVLHYLTKLSSFWYDSFIYWLWIECIEEEKWIDKSIWDCDIFCLKNGNMILCEIKYDRWWFSEKDFTNLKIIAEKVKPNIIIFAAYGKPSNWVNKNLEKRHKSIKSDLDKYAISIKFESIESSYIRIN